MVKPRMKKLFSQLVSLPDAQLLMKPLQQPHIYIYIYRVPFIVTYNPALPNIRGILHKKQPILDSTEGLHNIFSETPVVAFHVHLTYAIYWFAPSLKLPKVIHSAILLVLSVAIRDTAVSLALTSMTVEPPTRSAPRVRHGRSNNTSLANQTILLI